MLSWTPKLFMARPAWLWLWLVVFVGWCKNIRVSQSEAEQGGYLFCFFAALRRHDLPHQPHSSCLNITNPRLRDLARQRQRRAFYDWLLTVRRDKIALVYCSVVTLSLKPYVHTAGAASHKLSSAWCMNEWTVCECVREPTIAVNYLASVFN